MKSHSHVMVLVLLAAGTSWASTVKAQQADSLTRSNSNGAIAATPADTAVHKKGGMFGKLKSVAKNKTVQSIAKAAVCTAVPGGQYMVGAVDAAQAKGGAGAIASGAVNSASCIPGVGGMGAGALGGKAGLVGAGAAGAMGALGGAGQAQGLAQAAAMSGMMRGAPGAAPAGMPNAQQVAAMQAMMAQMQARGAAAGAVTTEAAGEQTKLSGTPADEIKKGKLTIKQIDWIRGSPGVSPNTTPALVELMTTVAQAMKAAGGTYHVDVYMDKRYSDGEVAALGVQRAGMLVSVLQDRAQLGDAVAPGKIGKDKEQRVEIVKNK